MGIEYVLFGVGGEPTSLLGSTTMAFLVAALPEETFKLLALWLVLRKNPYFDEHFDGIVYAVCVGLGFAAVENVFYVLGEEENWVGVAIARSLLSVPGHYAFAVLMGYYYSRYRFGGHSASDIASMFCIPVIAHGIYDSIVFSMQLDSYIVTFCFIALIVFCVKMHKNALRKIKEQIARDEVEKEMY
jgi:RsiW-degrading membrane proteinase PrsW (M82 family)